MWPAAPHPTWLATKTELITAQRKLAQACLPIQGNGATTSAIRPVLAQVWASGHQLWLMVQAVQPCCALRCAIVCPALLARTSP